MMRALHLCLFLAMVMALVILGSGCRAEARRASGDRQATEVRRASGEEQASGEERASGGELASEEARERKRMVLEQIQARGVTDPRVLRAMERVERHRFMPAAQRPWAYADRPLSIGHNQTISQPYIVAAMTEALRPKPTDRVLEIGTGSGYQAAVAAEVVREVYTIEIVKPLAVQARKLIEGLGYGNVHFRIGDGYRGWPEKQPFDGILVTAAPPEVPKPLLEQLKVGGRLVMPVGVTRQELIRITRTATGYSRERLFGVRFVPMTGEAQEKGPKPRSP